MISFEVLPKKVVVKQQDVDMFGERRVKLIAKFIKDYKEIVKESFGDQASEVKADVEISDLNNQMYYYTALASNIVVKK